MSTETVRKWRSRFVARRMAGLVDESPSDRRKPELVCSEAGGCARCDVGVHSG
ncbi:helix-turn-helix domain-containing protein [Streptomyces olivaceoviridis]|uniref:helix-turn-helix domain-containing protein n=1 Tax=Streptomyces olivaceoviridis TaxID=1921 RepID=UPI00339FF147